MSSIKYSHINTSRIDRRFAVRGQERKEEIYRPPVPNFKHDRASRGGSRRPLKRKRKNPAVHRYPEGYPEEHSTQKQEIVKQYFPLQLPFAAVKRKIAKVELRLKIKYSIKRRMFLQVMQLAPVVKYICNYFELTYVEYDEFFNLIVSGSKEQIILSLLD